jgi:hypothetical protein
MPYKDVTYDNGLTERFYYDETPLEEAKRMARINRVAKFPSMNYLIKRRKSHDTITTHDEEA